MRVYAVQYDIAWEDKSANHGRIDEMLAKAEPAPGSFVVLPELGDTGFSFNLDVIVDDQSIPWAAALAERHGVYVQVGYAVRGTDGRGRNCATIIDPSGRAVSTYEKVHPFSFGREVEHFTGGDTVVLARCGDAVIAPAICYDLRFPELFRLGALAGAEVFTLGASWPNARQAHWRALLIARAIENQACVIGVNRTGSDPHLSYAGGSIIVDHMGQVLAEAGDTPAVIEAEVDLTALRTWREDFPALRDVREHIGIDRSNAR